MYTYIYGAVLLIGAVLTYFALKQYKLTKIIVSQGERTEAVVIDFLNRSDGEGELYMPVYEYVDLSGNIKQFNSPIEYSEPTLKVGDMVPVIYNQNNNDDVKLDSYWGLYRWTIILLALASPFLIIGGGYILYIMY